MEDSDKHKKAEEFVCPHCTLKCITREVLEKHDKFYHQPWPSSCQSEPKEDEHSESLDSLDSNSNEVDDCDGKEQMNLEAIQMANTENFENFIDQARSSKDISKADAWWEKNRVFSVKKSKDHNASKEFHCWICHDFFENNAILEEHIESCFENCNI